MPEDKLKEQLDLLKTNIKYWYNGYRFYPLKQPKFESNNKFAMKNVQKWKEIAMYNPTSVLHFLKAGEFKNYWVKTGTLVLLLIMHKINYC